MSNSIVDYVFRALGMEYLGRNDLVQVPPTDDELPGPPKGLVVDAGQQLELTESQKEADIDAQMTAAAFVDENGNGPEPSNGNGHGRRDGRNPNGQKRGVNLAEKVQVKVGASAPAATTVATQADPMASALVDLMGDAPLCDTCGHITVRNGSCYRCLNCGNSMGCS
jgi:ribonucleoside-diphosphate reductase alpha chain